MTAAAASGPGGTPRAASLWLLWLGTWLLFVCFAHGNFETTDATITMHEARALLLRGDSGMRLSADAEPLDERLIAADIVVNHRHGKVGVDGAHAYAWFPIGHVYLMLPCVALGEALGRAFPGVEARYREFTAPGVPEAELPGNENYRDGHFVWSQGAVALLLPAASGATILLLLLLIASAFGCSSRQALLVAGAIVFGTQCFALARETLSNGPGLALLLTALLAVVRYHQGLAGWKTLLWGGCAAGASVLLRYEFGYAVPVLALAVLLAARRRGQLRDVLAFAVGGLPFAALLAAVNHARFGSVGDTGYLAFGTWFVYPTWVGVLKLLFAGGKGILWFSPVLWFGLWSGLRRRSAPQLRWLGWTLLWLMLLLFGSTPGWSSGQCWGARYVTPGLVALLAIVLPQERPWQRRPRLFVAVCGLGLLVNFTSLLAPTRAHDQLAGQALLALSRQQLAAGKITAQDARALAQSPDDWFFTEWRYSPLHANWTYAGLALRGSFGDDQAHPKRSPVDTIEPLFSVSSDNPDDGLAPVRWEDRGFRHLWFVFWGRLFGVPALLLLLPVAVAAWAVLRAARRRLLQE